MQEMQAEAEEDLKHLMINPGSGGNQAKVQKELDWLHDHPPKVSSGL